MLMITSTVGMFNGVHAHTTDLGPAVTFHLVLVVSTSSFQQGFVDTTSACNDTHTGPVERRDHFLDTTGQFDTSDIGILVMGHNGRITTRCTGQLSTVTTLLFDVADDCSLGHDSNWKDVSDLEGSLLATVHELSGVHAFGGDEEFLPQLELIRISEDDDSKWSTSARIMDDLLHDSFDVTITFSVIQRSQLCWPLSKLLVSSEDTSRTFTLSSDHSSHVVAVLLP